MKYSENIIYDNIDNKDFFNKIEAIKTYTEGKNLKYHIVTYGCQMNVVRPILKLHKKGHRPIYI